MNYCPVGLLQPHTATNSQPNDQGIIKNLKRHYKKPLPCRELEAMDEGKEFNFTLLYTSHGVLESRSAIDDQELFREGKSRDAELVEIWEAKPEEKNMQEYGEIEPSDFL
ncbi:hypothetical protein RF11_00576 [Thelohanellus kitauei]|uniref:Uncharacterized protein n=1 Tax=Thelohanellus kitauei TaxID=669202 RepID=A0A0C2NJK7_THEKT|nr:hypothetical protein RF11_00576 [Thelohanellus kitauei]